MRMAKLKVTSATTLVLEYLRREDDFRTSAQVVAAVPQHDRNAVTVALFYLRRRKAIDAMDVDGRLYWFALPPELDDRAKVTHEHVPSGPRRKRRARS